MRIIQIRIDYERDDEEKAPGDLGEIVSMSICGNETLTVKATYEQEMDGAKIVGNIVLHPHAPREETH